MISPKTAASLLLLLWFGAALAADPQAVSVLTADQHWTSDAQRFQLRVESSLQPIEINRIHHWTLHLTDAEGRPVTDAVLEIEGGMPDHDHGLPTRPRFSSGDGLGSYRLEGLRFHMPGDWKLKLSIRAGELSDVVQFPLRL